MISVIWVVMVLLVIVLVTQTGLEFMGILILLGIAAGMTLLIMGYGGAEVK